MNISERDECKRRKRVWKDLYMWIRFKENIRRKKNCGRDNLSSSKGKIEIVNNTNYLKSVKF